MKISLELGWQIEIGGARYELEPVLFELLEGVERGGHLNFAAAAAGVSYRHAWGLMRSWEGRLRQPLLHLQRGRGATLAPAGRAMLDARARAVADTRPALLAAASGASGSLAEVLREVPGSVRMASSSSDLIKQLATALGANDWKVVLDLVGSEGALRRYQRGEVDIAGFHLPLGALGRSVGHALLNLLEETRDQIFLLELRVLGLMSRPARPVHELGELAGGKVRLVNRQAGSGTRLVLDGLLGLQGIAPGDIAGYRDEEYTHSAVAATVASGGADVALGTAAAAEKFALQFVPLVQERFYLVLRRTARRELASAVGEFARAALAGAARPPAAAELAPALKFLRRLHGAL